MARSRLITLALLAAMAAAGSFAAAAPPGAASNVPTDLTVHEWGTFTTVAGSDGVLLPGLEAAEEELPAFVRSHDGMGVPNGKGWARPLYNVTVRMETPVLYFYSPRGLKARVDVGFEGGSISQWFPERTGGERPPSLAYDASGKLLSGAIDFAEPYQGSIRWDVDVLPPGDYPASRLFHGGETLSWILPRQTESNLVMAPEGTLEKYLFYRGVGNLELSLVTTMPDEDTVRLRNASAHGISHLVVYERPADAAMPARFGVVEGLGGGDVVEVSRRALSSRGEAGLRTGLTDLLAARDWRDHAFDALSDVLVDAGLYRDEADAMVQTWWHSYFERPGLRVFWVLPSAEVERILPLRVEPAPSALARVIVGRAEVLPPSFEQRLAGELADPDSVLAMDRFAGAYRARAEALTAADADR